MQAAQQLLSPLPPGYAQKPGSISSGAPSPHPPCAMQSESITKILAECPTRKHSIFDCPCPPLPHHDIRKHRKSRTATFHISPARMDVASQGKVLATHAGCPIFTVPNLCLSVRVCSRGSSPDGPFGGLMGVNWTGCTLLTAMKPCRL